jgi:hypothetical protein
VSDRYSFEDVWRPPFVSTPVDEDRSHLNGLAMRDCEPAYITAVSRSDTIDGWRDRRADGGVVVGCQDQHTCARGLSTGKGQALVRGLPFSHGRSGCSTKSYCPTDIIAFGSPSPSGSPCTVHAHSRVVYASNRKAG